MIIATFNNWHICHSYGPQKYEAYHDDYDGAIDSHDDRLVYGDTIAEVTAAIVEYESEDK